MPQCQVLLTQVPPETGKVLGTEPSRSAAGSGTSPILCEISVLRSLVVRFLQGGKLSSQSLETVVLAPRHTHLLAFLCLLEHTACSKAEEAWPRMLQSLAPALILSASCMFSAAQFVSSALLRGSINLTLAEQQKGTGFVVLRDRIFSKTSS